MNFVCTRLPQLPFLQRLSLVVLFLLVASSIFAQTPGGVTQHLEGWYWANDHTVTNNSTAPLMNRATNTPMPASHTTAPGRTDFYQVVNDFNHNRSIKLDDEYFDSPININRAPFQDQVHVFIVYKTLNDPNIGRNRYLWGNGRSAQGREGRQGTTEEIGDGSGKMRTSHSNAVEQIYINHVNYNEGDTTRVFIDGRQIFARKLGSTVHSANLVRQGLIIGMDRLRPRIKPKYKLAEFIVYSDSLTPLDRQKITTHLGIQYGIPLAHDYVLSNNSIAWHWDHGTPSYNYNTIGIAYDTSNTGGALVQTISSSERTGDHLEISAPHADFRTLGGIRSLVVGHNNLATGGTPVAFNPGNHFFGGGVRSPRVWRCEQRGGYEDYTIVFKNGIQLPTGFEKDAVVLLMADDPDFTVNVQAHRIPSNNNDDLVAESVSFGSGTSGVRYITIGYLDAALWVKADALDNDVDANSHIQLMKDQVFGINNLTGEAIATGADAPDHVTPTNNSEMNFNPYIRLNAGAERNFLQLERLQGLGKNGSAIFLVMRRNLNNFRGRRETFLSYANFRGANTRFNGNTIWLNNPEDISIAINDGSGNGHATGANVANNFPHIIGHTRGKHYRDSVPNSPQKDIIEIDGFPYANTYRQQALTRKNGYLILGQEQDDIGVTSSYAQNQEYNGDIAELIIYNRRIDQVDVDRINTYLAIKYGIMLDTAKDYRLSDGSTSWPATNNTDFYKNIAGIGRDDQFQLLQEKSTSQRPAADGVVVTVERIDPLPNLSHLVWGASSGAYDLFSIITAIPGYEFSNRRWKVANHNNVGLVRVSMKTPNTTFGLSSARLYVSDNPNFTGNNTRYYTVVLSPGNTSLNFERVQLNDGDYFALGFDSDAFYSNNDPGSPNSFEACAGSNVTFYYTDLIEEPDRVALNSSVGPNFEIEVPKANITFSTPVIDSSGATLLYSGFMTFTIPDEAISGVVTYRSRTGAPMFSSPTPLIIHNPIVDFFPQTTPVCADATTPLLGYPQGGAFTTVIDTVIVTDSTATPVTHTFYGAHLNWGPTHRDFIQEPVTYTYFPRYLSGELCHVPKEVTKNVEVRDNRLTSLEFNPIYRNVSGNNPNELLEVDSQTIQRSVPDLLNGTPFTSTASFSGPYVNTSSELLVSLAPTASLVRLRFDNQGCIAEYESYFYVYEDLAILGFPSILCSEALPDTFTRDSRSSIGYNQTINTLSGNRTETIDRNVVYNVFTVDSSDQRAIRQINTTLGAETYVIDPTALNNSLPDTVMVTMSYATITKIRNSMGVVQSTTISGQFQTTDTVILVPPPVVNIDSILDPTYCHSDGQSILSPIPHFESPTTTYFSVYGDTSANATVGYTELGPTLIHDTVFVAGVIYDNIFPPSNRDLPVQLVYTAEGYGCIRRDTVYSIIIAPLSPIFSSKPSYCTDEGPDLLQRTFASGTALRLATLEFDTTTAWLDSVGNFSPSIAGPGLHSVTLVAEDQDYFCLSYYTDTLFVRTPPDIELLLDSSNANTRFCGSDTLVLMDVNVLSGGRLMTTNYFGAGVTMNILNPSTTFSNLGAAGNSPVWARVVDSSGCSDSDTLTITIVQPPTVDIGVAFNRRRRTIGNVTADHAYCQNADQHSVFASPRHYTGRQWRFTGAGIDVVGDSVYFNPSLADADSIHRITYTFTDQDGCVNSDVTYIQIDTVPIVSLDGLNAEYCVNSDSVLLTGTPSTTGSTLNTGFSGQGVDPATGVFKPSLGGVGQHIITYTYEDLHLCQGIDEDTIIIHTLTPASFSGYAAQYCTGDPDDQLISDNDQDTSVVDPSIVSSYRFWGVVVADTTGVLHPDSTALLPIDSILGPQTIYYAYTDTNGCTSTRTENIFINLTPTLEISGLDSSYCFNSTTIRVAMNHPAQVFQAVDTNFGIFSGALFFEPGANTPGYKEFQLTYTDPVTRCSDTLNSRTFVYQPVAPTYTGLDSLYCETQDTIPLTRGGATAGRSSGFFSGGGIVFMDTTTLAQGFNPARIGTGFHTITYAVEDTLYHSTGDTLICIADAQKVVAVRPLPRPRLIYPTDNARFCSNDTNQWFLPVPTVDTLNNVFTSLTGGVHSQDTFIQYTIVVGGQTFSRIDTVPHYYFSPDSAGAGTHIVLYTATNQYGCSDSSEYTYTVDQYRAPGLNLILDSVYCESQDSIQLYDPRGGIYTLNGDTIRSYFGRTPYFSRTPDYVNGIGVTTLDTVVFHMRDGACAELDTVVVRINPLPIVSFVTEFYRDTLCIGMVDVDLIPSPVGGDFSGNGVSFDTSLFQPTSAGPGIHWVHYNYTDTLTGCSNVSERQLYVYNMPNAQFNVLGGCEVDSSLFMPNNDVLGLGDILIQNRVLDSITSVHWVFDPSTIVAGSANSNRVDSIVHTYTSPGIYYTQLIVANQVFCVDTHTVRLVISPQISTFPYDETFESGAGNWYAESATATGNILWEWGIDSTVAGIPRDINNHLWATGLGIPFGASQEAWVYSPCFDISTLTRPMISLDYWSNNRLTGDGVVMEYQNPDGTWSVLGERNRGIDWYNTQLSASLPGDQQLAPVGWSGESTAWRNGRYRLDDYRGPNDKLRLRIAFASAPIPLSNFQDGFGFDNVWIGNRTRNVMLETTSHNVPQNMERDNRHVYDLVFNTELEKDVVMAQYHVSSPDLNDEFYQQSSTVSNSRGVVIGNATGGYALIDGDSALLSYNLRAVDFEQSMLEDPKFDIRIDTFSNISNIFTIVATVTAREDMPFSDYRIHTIITEDSLYYSNLGDYSDELYAVVRKDNGGGAPYTERKAWFAGETKQVTFTWDHSNDHFIQYEAKDFEAVVFIQDPGARQIFQAQTTRVATGYRIGVDPILVEDEYNEVASMVLFPNPAEQAFHLRFDAPLSTDYQWRLVDLRGVEVKTGVANAGTELLTIQSQDYPAGTYVLLLYNDHVFAQRKVILRQ